MNTKIEKLENSIIKLEFKVPAEKFEEAIQYSYNKNKKSFNIPGFRKGFVPRDMVEKYYGQGVLLEDAMDYIASEEYVNAIKEHDLKVVARPEMEVEQAEKGKEFIFNLKVTVKPEVTLGDYKGLEIEKISDQVTEEEIQSEIDKVREKNVRMVTITDRPIKENDKIILDFEGFVDGVAFAGGKAEDYELIIGSHTFIDNFEEQLVDKKIGEEVEINVNFPEKYHQPDLAGKKAMFKVKIKGIEEKVLPEVDDEFVKDVSEFDTLEQYKNNIKEKLSKFKEKDAKVQKENKLIKKVVENSKLEVPQVMVDSQVDRLVHNFEMRLSSQGINLEQYINITGQTIESLRESLKLEAKTQVKSMLVLESIVKNENIEVTEKDIEEEVEKLAKEYNVEVEIIKSNIQGDRKQDFIEELKIQKAIEILINNSKEV